ncbi:MAG: virulence RhuM family protein [Planctomycetaceae bacterium]|jgi:hypothetical protein|nr:virulence RhuM family protein [Planctomycetaceae bacterium]
MNSEKNKITQPNEFSIYSDDDGMTRVNVRFNGEDVWLTQNQIALLYQTTKQNISLHINNVFSESELQSDSVVKDFLTTATDGKHYKTKHYNLDMIIAVGYRVKSPVATRFRRWATQRLHEYIQKGFTLDDERMKSGNSRYFRELLQRIRDIRSSERNLYQQVTDIYATAVDYDPRTEMTREFFATVQNKLHFATHQHTAAEVIYERVSAKKPLVGMTNFKGNYITKDDVRVAKNYLDEKELQYLNLLVGQFLDFAELQALQQKKMTMSEWIAKLDEMITFSGTKLLTGKGKISREQANKKADQEFTEYRQAEMLEYESDYDRAIKELVEKTKKKI